MREEMILELLSNREYKQLKKELESIHPVDIATIMEELEDKQVLMVFRLLEKEEAAETFTEMSSDSREILLNTLNDEEVRDVLEEMYLDDTVDILEELPANVVDRVLEMTDDNTRQRINEILNYPDDSAGSIMTVEYISLRKEMTVADAILKIRQVGINKETIYTCYVTEKKRLIGYVTLKDLLGSRDDKMIADIMDSNIITAHTNDDQEDVAKLTRKYSLLAVPVVDNESCLVGIVTVDDVMIVLQDETTEDMNKMAAMLPAEEDYFDTTVWQHAINRIPWLLFLMLSATITGMIMNYYDGIIAALPILISFVPMLMDTGGNCGSQSASLIIRGLAVDEIHFSDTMKVVFKEFRIALGVGMFLAIVNTLRIGIMYNSFGLGIVLGITLICTIIMSKMIGSVLPLAAAKVGMDPAIMAAPLITTVVDCTSLLVYFGIVSALFVI